MHDNEILWRISEPLAQLAGSSEVRRGRARSCTLSGDQVGAQRKLEIEFKPSFRRSVGEPANELNTSPRMRDGLEIGRARPPAGPPTAFSLSPASV